MTRSSLTARNLYTGAGSTDTYSYGFQVDLEADLYVVERIIATGVETVLTLTTNYTTTGVGNTAGGTIVLVAGNLPTTKKILVRRKPTPTQITDIRNQGTYFPETHELEFDKRNDIAQDHQDQLDRCIKFAETIDATAISSEISGLPTAGSVASVNAAADGLEWVDIDADALATAVAATAADVVSTNADVVSTNADVVTTNADVVLTNADVVTTAASAAAAAASALAVRAMGVSSNIQWACTSDTQIVVAAGGKFTGFDSGVQYTIGSSLTLDITGSVGSVLGLNTGAEASNTHYYIIALGKDSTPTVSSAWLVSAANYASFTTSDLPAGYDDYKRIGSIRNNGSSNFIHGHYQQGKFFIDLELSVGSTASATFTNIDASAVIPLICRAANIIFDSSAGGAAIKWRPDGSALDGHRISTATGSDATMYTEVLLTAAQIFEARTSTGTVGMFLTNYLDNLENEGQ